MRKLNYIAVDRTDAAKGVENTHEMQKAIQDGHSLMIFPEGTFSYAAGLRPFKLGAFKIAAETGAPICPIAIKGSRNVLRGEERLLSPHRIQITVTEPIAAKENNWEEITRLKIAVREQIAKNCGEPTLDLIVAGIAAPRDKTAKDDL